MAEKLAKLLGTKTLKGKSGDVQVDTLADKKYILLYFSAHWCPPCRQFTPMLSKTYNTLKEGRNDFEIIWLSSDESQREYDEYYKDHPWLALPFDQKKSRERLSRKYRVQGIPNLVVLDQDLKVVTKKARDAVPDDPEGKKFPWKPRDVHEILGETRISAKSGSIISVDDLKKKEYFALYFSAHWCAPCRAFTPRLVSLHRKLMANKVDTEIIFCSSDRDESQYQEYYAEMPWASLPFMDAKVQELKELLEVQSIPTLVMLKGDGTVVSTEARAGAAEDHDASKFPWKPQPLSAVAELVPSGPVVKALNEETCVILALNGAANSETPKIEFTRAGEKFNAEVNPTLDDENKVRFLISDAIGSELFNRVLLVLGAQVPKPGQATVLVFNLPNDRAKEVLPTEVSESAVFELVKKFALKLKADNAEGEEAAEGDGEKKEEATKSEGEGSKL